MQDADDQFFVVKLQTRAVNSREIVGLFGERAAAGCVRWAVRMGEALEI